MSELLALAIAAALIALFAWPRYGLMSLWKHFRELTRKEHVEHTLKYLHHCEYSGLSGTLEGVAGVLRLSRNRVADLVCNLEAAGLVSTLKGGLALTVPGRREALRVIRIHRLWERYFADRSGLDEALWHDEADRREHTTPPEQAERMAASLGHPRFDPHGTPIPTASGDLPAARGQALTNLAPRDRGRIIHLEDEPTATYQQLVAQGLVVGAIVHVLDLAADRIRLEVDGEEQALAPVVAGNVTVERLERTADSSARPERLSQLSLGEAGRVVGFLAGCRGIQRRRLLDLGLVSGTVVQAELRSSTGDPTAYRIRGALIALRGDQASQVQIQKLGRR